MVFQGSIDLKIAAETVHAVIDFETGRIGFTAIDSDGEKESDYSSAPKEYKVAFLDILMPQLASERLFNGLINPKMV